MVREMLVGIAAALAWGPGAAAQDANKISPPEEALKELTALLPNLVKEADADGSGTLNNAEFRPFVRRIKKTGQEILNRLDPTIGEKKAAKALKKYDANGDGALDESEKKVQAEEARLKEIKDFDWDRNGQLSEREKTALQWAEEGKLDYVFTKTDTSGDREVSQDEVLAALSSLTGIKVKKAN